MTTAVVTSVFGSAAVCLIDGDALLVILKVSRGDGPGPVPAASTVLERNGWKVAGEWVQQSGGISGGEWVAAVEPIEEMR